MSTEESIECCKEKRFVGEPKSKRQRLDAEDLRTKEMVAISRYCQEQWVRKMVKMHISRGEHMKLAVLSRDEGCGKSCTISLLEKKLTSLNMSIVVCAMTNKAVSTRLHFPQDDGI